MSSRPLRPSWFQQIGAYTLPRLPQWPLRAYNWTNIVHSVRSVPCWPGAHRLWPGEYGHLRDLRSGLAQEWRTSMGYGLHTLWRRQVWQRETQPYWSAPLSKLPHWPVPRCHWSHRLREVRHWSIPKRNWRNKLRQLPEWSICFVHRPKQVC